MFHFLWKQLKMLNGVTGSTFSVVFMAWFYLTGVLSAPW